MNTLTSSRTSSLVPAAHRGIGMIEVLIALLMVAVGVVGMSKFQGTFLRDGNTAKTRAIAAQLAREKLDDLKSFSQLPSGGAGVFGYGEIGNSDITPPIDVNMGGGAETNAGTLRLPSGTVQVSNTNYQRNWTALTRYYCGANAAPTEPNCTGTAAKARPDFLALRVTITWTDQDGVAQTLSLDDVAASIDPSSVASSVLSGVSASSPVVPYTPGVAPNVIAIDVGGSQKKETTNPTPTLNKSGQTIINTIARYETIRFSANTNTITREEFTTLNCLCTQSGAGQGYNMQNVLVAKNVGVPANNNQVPECKACCRDHHDDQTCNPATSAGKNNCYDPFRPSSDYTGNDHNHYTANGSLANASGNTYVEACRMKRIDGVLQVDQDWNLTKISLIPENFFAVSGTPNATNVTNYGNYVRSFVAAYLSGGTAPTPPWPVASTVNLNANRPYAARGIYIDYIDDTAKAAYATRISNNDATVYQEIPFYEVNLTKLAQWSSANTTIATVRNDQVVSELSGENLYTRGVVTGKAFGLTDINVSTTAGNAGVINEFITVDPQDGSVRIADDHEVTVPGTNPTISGNISPIVSGATVVADNGGSCSYTNGTGAYSCSVPYGWTGGVTPTAAGFIFTPASRSYAAQITSLTGQNFTSVVSTTQYNISGNVTPILASVTFTASGATCSYDNTTGAYNCVVPSGWNGTVAPSSGGYTFAPGQRTYTNVAANSSAQNYTATAVAANYTITGTITPGPASVNFNINNGGSCSFNNSTDVYTCTVPSGWTGSIAPTASQRVFTPTGRNYTNVTANLAGQDYNDTVASFLISGTVAPDTSGTSFSTNNGGGACTYTPGSPNGAYSCTVPANWSGSVTPAAGSTKQFSPTFRSYTNVTSDNVTENYTVMEVAANITFTITGNITGLSKGNPSITPSAGASCTIQTRSPTAQCTTSCSYSCSITISSGSTWSGTLTPSSSGSGSKTFTPASRSYSGINSNQTQNFSCAGGGC